MVCRLYPSCMCDLLQGKPQYAPVCCQPPMQPSPAQRRLAQTDVRQWQLPDEAALPERDSLSMSSLLSAVPTVDTISELQKGAQEAAEVAGQENATLQDTLEAFAAMVLPQDDAGDAPQQ